YVPVQVVRSGAHKDGATRVQPYEKVLGGRVPEALLHVYPDVVVTVFPGRIGQGDPGGQKAIKKLVLIITDRSSELEPLVHEFFLQLQVAPKFVIGDGAIDVREDGPIGVQDIFPEGAPKLQVGPIVDQ